jgi:NAD(P)H-hydrate epimerase
MLIDADGLRLLATIENWQNKLPKPCVLTPHPGEMSALTGLSTAEIQKDRVGVAQRFAKEWGHIVLLKGAFTVIASPDGRAVIEPFATAALAKAGSGDVLSGIIGGLLAQKVEPFEAAIAGGFLHGRAAEFAAQKLRTSISVVASDILWAISSAAAELTLKNSL